MISCRKIRLSLIGVTFLLLCSIVVNAQDNKPATKPPPVKPVFQVPMDKDIPVTLTLKLKALQLNDYVFVLQNGAEKITHSQKLTASQATEIINTYNLIADSINRVLSRHWLEYYRAQQKVFNDTVGKHGKK